MKKLVKGIIDFRKNSLAIYRDKFAELAAGQSPDVLFIACCDSRVVPNVFASTDPGDLFVLRNIGNLVPPFHEINKDHPCDTSVAATIELSLKGLNVAHIIICGHSDCAAMRFFTDRTMQSNFSYVKAWLKYAEPSYKRFKKTLAQHTHRQLQPHNCLSQINVLQQLAHIQTYPWVQERLQNKTLRLHGWWFEIATADVYHYDKEQDDFIILDEEHAAAILQTL